VVSTHDAGNGAADTTGADAPLSAAAQQYVTTFAEPYCNPAGRVLLAEWHPISGLGPCEAYELSFVQNHLDDGSEVIVPSAVQTLLDQIQTSCDQPPDPIIVAVTAGTIPSGQHATSCRAGAQATLHSAWSRATCRPARA